MTEQTGRLQEIGEESKRRILDAAEELFAEKGFKATTFVEIGKRCGISHGSIPWHFDNKYGLLMAVIERGVARSIPDEELAAGPDGLHSTIAATKEWLRVPTARMLDMVLIEAIDPASSVHARYVEFHRASRDRIVRWLERSASFRRETATADDANLAVVVVGAIIGIHLQYQLDPESVELDDALDALTSLVLQATMRARRRA